MAYRRFTIPRAIYYGTGALEALGEMRAQRALVVTDPLLVRLGVAERVRAALVQQGAAVRIFDQVEPDPSRETVARGAAAAAEFQPDLIVGLGGGSPIDVAKALWVFYEHPDLPWEQATTFFEIPPLRQKARLVTIPTTSGRGSEVSFAAMVTNETVEPPCKECLLSYDLSADVAIVDGELTATMPPKVTADTGFDVLSHAFEAYVSRFAGDLTFPLATGASRLVFTWLPRAYDDGEDVEARQHMHNASMLAGMAMASAALGVCHSLAHQLGALFHIPHGRACAYTMCQAIGFNAPAAGEGYVRLARDLYIEGAAVPGLIDALDTLKRRVGIPTAFREAGVEEEIYMAALNQMVEMAYDDGNRESNPRTITRDALRQLFVQVWEGTTDGQARR